MLCNWQLTSGDHIWRNNVEDSLVSFVVYLRDSTATLLDVFDFDMNKF